MDWKEKIEKAMKDLSNACKENHEWGNCPDCPFAKYCSYIMVYDSFPQKWYNNEEEEE